MFFVFFVMCSSFLQLSLENPSCTFLTSVVIITLVTIESDMVMSDPLGGLAKTSSISKYPPISPTPTAFFQKKVFTDGAESEDIDLMKEGHTIQRSKEAKTKNNTSSKNNTVISSIKETTVADFDTFFWTIPEQFFEQTEHDMFDIMKAEREILEMSSLQNTTSTNKPSKGGAEYLSNDFNNSTTVEPKFNSNPNNVTTSGTKDNVHLPSHASRKRRSAARTAYRNRLIARHLAEKRVICRRRCVWYNIWCFVKSGVMKDHPCNC